MHEIQIPLDARRVPIVTGNAFSRPDQTGVRPKSTAARRLTAGGNFRSLSMAAKSTFLSPGRIPVETCAGVRMFRHRLRRIEYRLPHLR